MKRDNASAHLSSAYDQQVRQTIPYYDCFHTEVINLVKAVCPSPDLWLDTGCGTGTLAERIHKEFPQTRFLLADPSEGMLEEAKKKLEPGDDGRICCLPAVSTQDLVLGEEERPEVITAVQAHHYLQEGERRSAVQRCHDLLKTGGIFITFENIRPATPLGIEIGKRNWVRFQRSAGRDAETAAKHMERFDTEYFPITIEEHLRLMEECGFQTVELLWHSYMQAGFYCIKE